DASIKIVGASTVKARYHYLDANGQDQYIEIPGLTQTVNDNVDTLKDDYPKQAADFTNVEKALIPKGYKLDTGVPTIIDTKNDGAAKLGTVAQYFDDGDFVQYELVGNVTAQVKYVDDDNNGAVVGTPKTISGAPGTSINWDMGTVPTGYRLATGAATTGSYTFHDANNVPFEIQLNHIVDHSTTTTTRTITYKVNDANYPGQVPETQTQTIKWNVSTDEVTGAGVATAQNAYDAQTAPTIPGYTADTPTVAQKAYGSVTGDKLPQAKADDVTVTYTPVAQTAQVEYVDDENNGAVVGTPTTLTGQTAGSA
ncbi:mucin-binding protein, partial [Secundilactobacillus silagei]